MNQLVVTHELTVNPIPDAQLAALAIGHGVPVASADSDFARFPEVRWVNPCA
jgi:predicted nucleic acid-binding protein